MTVQTVKPETTAAPTSTSGNVVTWELELEATAMQVEFTRDTPVTLAPLAPVTALRALLSGREMSDEIDADEDQAKRLASARAHAREGAVSWDEDEPAPSTDTE